jgi:hypothetical protein
LGEQRPHRRPHRLDREGVDAIVDEDQPARADRVTGAQDGPEIAGVAQRLGDDPDAGRSTVDPVEPGVELAIDADDGLGIVLARQLGEDVAVGLDRLAALGLDGVDQRLGERMPGAVLREEDIFGQDPGLGRLGQDPQPLGEEQPFLAPVPLLAERADALDQRVGKGGDLAGQGDNPVTSSFQRRLESHFFGARGRRK